MQPALKTKLTKADYKVIEKFLESDETPEDCMNLSMMDGFLTAIVIGPDMIQPSQWIPVLFGVNSEDDTIGKSHEKMQRIFGLLLAHYNILISTFDRNPVDFKPILSDEEQLSEDITIIDDWCCGFMVTYHFSQESWKPLVEDPDLYKLFSTIALRGTESGLEEVKNDQELQSVSHKQWVSSHRNSILGMNEYWKPIREIAGRKRVKKSSEKINRNAPCPCGSGKKYKKCCLEKTH